ncbi:MAG: hypothetical protein L3J93_05570 [Thermoplasmata archaeon]|nr:hypothetical protein [Thermoplasmata archaeon]
MSNPLAPAIQAFLFALFAALTTILQTITGPTYEGLVVPELSPRSLYPPVTGGSGSFLSEASRFSEYLVLHLVDPAIVLVVVAIGLLYLTRSFLGRETARLEGILPRLVVYVVLANIAVPVGGALLDLAGSIYPTIAGFDGGAWQIWANLAGPGAIGFSWDNGALAFIVSFALFSLVLLLAAAIAMRDALIGVLLVLLPAFTLAGTIPALRPLARRAWLLFGEAAFLPCVMVVPLELAVGSPSVLFLLGYLTISLGSPALLSSAGSHLSQLGFPGAGSAIGGGLQRGLGFASLGASSYARPFTDARTATRATGVRGAIGAVGRTPFPLTLPIAAGELLGRGGSHLLRHLRPASPGAPSGGHRLDDPAFRNFRQNRTGR